MIHTQTQQKLSPFTRTIVYGGTNSDEATRLDQLERLAYWLDSVFRVPGIGLRVGFDALLDLIPGVGDALGTLLSLYILQAARTFGVPRITLVRMGLNIAIDFVGGLVPILGAVFDAYWKANIWNVGLIKRHLAVSPAQSRRARRGDWLVVVGIIAALVTLMIGVFALIAWLVAIVVRQF